MLPTHNLGRALLLLANVAGVGASLAALGACRDGEATALPPIHADPPRREGARDVQREHAADSLGVTKRDRREAHAPHAARRAAKTSAGRGPHDLEWTGVAASAGAPNVVAAWTQSDISFSRDGGKTFDLVLASPGHIDAGAIDARGELYVVREGNKLGVRAPHGETTAWRTLAFAKKTTSITTGAGTLAWIGAREGEDGEALALSSDAGLTWSFPTRPALGDFANEVTIDESGAIRLMTSNEAGCGGGFQARYLGDVTGGAWKDVAWPLDAPGSWAMGEGGWAYGLGDCGAEGGAATHLCGAGSDGEARAVAPVQGKTFTTLHAVTNGVATWGTIDGKLAWLSAGVVMFPAMRTPQGFGVVAVDAEGQPVGLAHGKVMRWTRDEKWHTLFSSSVGAV